MVQFADERFEAHTFDRITQSVNQKIAKKTLHKSEIL